MEKISRKPDHFETAAMRTLSKVNQTSDYVPGVTIGPNSTFLEHKSNNKFDLAAESKTSTFIEETVDEKKHFYDDNDKENDSLFLHAAKALLEMENLRQLNVTDNTNERAFKLMNHENELQSRMVENLKLSKEETNIKSKLRPKMIENSIHNDDLVISKKMHELIKRYTDTKLKSEEKAINEVNVKTNKDEDIKLKNERKQMLTQIQQEYQNVYKQILNTLSCKNQHKLILQANSDFLKIRELTANLSSVLEKLNSGNVSDQDVETCRMMLQCASVIADKLKNNAEQINFEEEERIARDQQAAEIQENSTKIVHEVVEETEPEDKNKDNAENGTNLEKCVCKESLVYYTDLNEKLTAFTKHVETFMNNVPSKSFLRKLKIAIGTPVNAISATDLAHMRDKFIKISRFLRGDFSLPTTPMPNVSKDMYFVFVVDLLCKHFISHAEKRFRPSTPQEGFLFASLALAIWSEFPQFGPILLVNIMKECPYAIPAYWPRYSGQSDQEYYISLGYQYKNNEIEDEHSFLNRMSGIFMLYVSLIVTTARRNQPHPYGIENAWKWIAAIVNLEPRPNITASLLHIFLETCGYKLSQCYGIQFRKIIQLLIEEYIFKIEKITPSDFRGPVSRLKLYLENVLRKGFYEPKGVLSADNWR